MMDSYVQIKKGKKLELQKRPSNSLSHLDKELDGLQAQLRQIETETYRVYVHLIDIMIQEVGRELTDEHVKVFKDYFVEGFKQVKIAIRYQWSQSQISNLITEASVVFMKYWDDWILHSGSQILNHLKILLDG